MGTGILTDALVKASNDPQPSGGLMMFMAELMVEPLWARWACEHPETVSPTLRCLMMYLVSSNPTSPESVSHLSLALFCLSFAICSRAASPC
jgi:hypothetical protein